VTLTKVQIYFKHILNGFENGLKEKNLKKKTKEEAKPLPLSDFGLKGPASAAPSLFLLWAEARFPSPFPRRPARPTRASLSLSGWRAGPTPSFTANRVPRGSVFLLLSLFFFPEPWAAGTPRLQAEGGSASNPGFHGI